MAEGKKGFLLYADLIHTFEHLTNEQRGEVMWWILEYVNDRDPEPMNGLLMAVTATIREQLKRDLSKYKKKKDQSSIAGRMGNLKRWNTDLYEKVTSENLTLEEAEIIANDRRLSPPDPTRSYPIAKIADNVNDTDSVTDTVNDINEVDSVGSSDEQPVPIKFSFRKSLSELGVEKDVIDDWLKVRKTKKATNSKIALNAIIREIEKSGKEANEIIKICVINSWSGFKNEWFKNTINNGKKPKSTSESRMDAIKNF